MLPGTETERARDLEAMVVAQLAARWLEGQRDALLDGLLQVADVFESDHLMVIDVMVVLEQSKIG